jgi:hypothetical protein
MTAKGSLRSVARVGFVGSALAASACASAPVVGAVAEAPQWFKDATIEMSGEAYPKLCDVRRPLRSTKTAAEWTSMQADLKAAAAQVEAGQADGAREDPLAWAARERALVEPPSGAHPAPAPPPVDR